MAVSEKINQLLYPEEEQKKAVQQKTNAYLTNPFLRRDGSLANKYLDYQAIVNNAATSDKVKKYIAEATGITPKIQKTVSVASENTTANADSGNTPKLADTGKFNGKIGFVSAKYEAGGWNPGRVSSGAGDHGGVSYGMPQFSTTQGSAKSFVNWLKQTNPEMGNMFGNYSPGSAEFTNAWKNVAEQHGDDFGNLQNQYTYDNMVVPFIQRAKKETGVDLSATPALRELAFSTAAQFGGAGTYALGNINPNMSETEIINAVYDNKINNYKTYFRSSSSNVQAGVRNRFINERNDLLALVN